MASKRKNAVMKPNAIFALDGWLSDLSRSKAQETINTLRHLSQGDLASLSDRRNGEIQKPLPTTIVASPSRHLDSYS